MPGRHSSPTSEKQPSTQGHFANSPYWSPDLLSPEHTCGDTDEKYCFSWLLSPFSSEAAQNASKGLLEQQSLESPVVISNSQVPGRSPSRVQTQQDFTVGIYNPFSPRLAFVKVSSPFKSLPKAALARALARLRGPAERTGTTLSTGGAPPVGLLFPQPLCSPPIVAVIGWAPGPSRGHWLAGGWGEEGGRFGLAPAPPRVISSEVAARFSLGAVGERRSAAPGTLRAAVAPCGRRLEGRLASWQRSPLGGRPRPEGTRL